MFVLGIAATVVVLFVLRPSLFTRPNLDFSIFEAVVEESIAELEKRQGEILREIEQKHQALLELQEQIIARFLPPDTQSPKVLAVLELARQDDDLMNIAKKLGLGVGEVQLILELNKDRQPLAESD